MYFCLLYYDDFTRKRRDTVDCGAANFGRTDEDARLVLHKNLKAIVLCGVLEPLIVVSDSALDRHGGNESERESRVSNTCRFISLHICLAYVHHLVHETSDLRALGVVSTRKASRRGLDENVGC